MMDRWRDRRLDRQTYGHTHDDNTTWKLLSLDSRSYRHEKPNLFLVLDLERAEILFLKNSGGYLFKIEEISKSVLWFSNGEMA